MPKKIICVVFIESEGAIRYYVVTDPSIIDDIMTEDSLVLSLHCDSHFPTSLAEFIDTTGGEENFPHYEYNSVENPMVISVYI